MAQPLTTEEPPLCLPPDPLPKRPSYSLPANACDCHAPICSGAQDELIAERLYTPVDCLIDTYQTVLRTLGLLRAVLVQPSFYGTDNGVLLAAMAAAAIPVRGVAVVPTDVNEVDLDRLHEIGIRGVRFNIVDIQRQRRSADRPNPYTRAPHRASSMAYGIPHACGRVS
jgi:2-pyrone-4,6-dicarboxylate lactonase